MLTLIIPAFNEEAELPECLSSIENQTADNFRLILVDNGSTDATLSIMQSFQRRGNKIKSRNNCIVIREPKIGKLNALNSALKVLGYRNCANSIIAFSDADTYFYPSWYEKVSQLYECNPSVSYSYSVELFKNWRLEEVPIPNM